MLDFLSALIPGTSPNARPSQNGLFGFPSTPSYGGRQSTTRTRGGVSGIFGFPATPAYLDASRPDPEPDPQPCEDPEGGGNDHTENARTPSDRAR